MKTVAPNSPRLMVKANIAAMMMAFEIIGKSTWYHTFLGDAPSNDAASLKLFGILLRLGRILRITKGKATKVCAMGISNSDERKLSGGLSSAIIKPNPSVTADVDSGNMKIGSKIATNRLLLEA